MVKPGRHCNASACDTIQLGDSAFFPSRLQLPPTILFHRRARWRCLLKSEVANINLTRFVTMFRTLKPSSPASSWMSGKLREGCEGAPFKRHKQVGGLHIVLGQWKLSRFEHIRYPVKAFFWKFHLDASLLTYPENFGGFLHTVCQFSWAYCFWAATRRKMALALSSAFLRVDFAARKGSVERARRDAKKGPTQRSQTRLTCNFRSALPQRHTKVEKWSAQKFQEVRKHPEVPG